MTDPRRLIDDDVTEFEAALLRAGRGEAPPPGARNRALAAVGIASGVVAATATATTAAAATKGGGFFAGALALKAFGAVVLVGAVSVGGVQYVKSRRAPAPQPTVQAPAPIPAKPIVVAAPVVVAKPTIASPDPTVAPEPPKEVAPSPTSAKLEAPAPQPSLTKELAVLDEARKALASDPTRALSLVDQHDKSFPGGALAQESTVLRIDALARLGRTSEAKSLAQTFLAAHPDSPNAPRVRKIIDTTSNPNP